MSDDNVTTQEEHGMKIHPDEKIRRYMTDVIDALHAMGLSRVDALELMMENENRLIVGYVLETPRQVASALMRARSRAEGMSE